MHPQDAAKPVALPVAECANRRPISAVQIELTNHCNYHCRFCPQSQWRQPEFAEVPFDRPKGYMAFDLFRRIVDEANEVASCVNFSFFGEPTMHPEFLRFMDYLKGRSSGLAVVMNTNLSLATREVFARLIEIGLDDLRISLDAATPETYDAVRPGKHFLDLDGNRGRDRRFDTVCGKAEYWHALSDHRPTRHVFTVNSRNLGDLPAFCSRWIPRLGPSDVILAKNVLTYGGKITDTLLRENPCNVWDLDGLTVDWRGRVSPCNLDTNMDLDLGSVQEAGLLELHRSRKRQELEKQSKARCIRPCSHCIDGNNWSRNVLFRTGDAWRDEISEVFAQPVAVPG